ncbi:Purine permease plant protein [Dioscorea alata]|uniref:Purine permease plant protein n=1 Tax=Dioscorea alata TaxID=55571 RepID=A0ACB7UYD6_DIOAL|nr:Purine permease plant protein [Dioscorea alata]
MSVCLTKSEIIAGSVDGTVRTFDIQIGRELVDDLKQPANCVSLSNDTNCILASCLDSTLRLLDRSSGELLQEYKGHTCKSFKMDCCLTNFDAHVTSGSEDGFIYFWDLADASVVSKFRAHASVVTSVSYHPKDSCMITSSVDGVDIGVFLDISSQLSQFPEDFFQHVYVMAEDERIRKNWLALLKKIAELPKVISIQIITLSEDGFNAAFSYFINSERFTHLTFNSVIILTFSAAIIACQPASDDSSETSGGKYMLGFILTLAASATYSLNLSLVELTFHKIIKCRALSAVLNMQIYTALVSTVGAIIGLFASGEWRELKKDMEGFNQGRLSYVMTLVWTSICWQVTNVGLVGLIFEVSSLFSNVISSLAVPIAPVFAVILFHDTINGIKVMSLLCPLLQYSIVFD